MQAHGYPQAPQPNPQKSGIGLVLVLVLVPVIVAVIGVLAVLAIYGVRRYIANAKTAEARASLYAIGSSAVAAYERDHAVCPSASAPVPANASAVSGKKYMSAPTEWKADAARRAGFACLGFEMMMPQYFQYSYAATPDGFTATARGDLDGDGVFSTYTLTGKVSSGRLVVAPSLVETDPGE